MTQPASTHGPVGGKSTREMAVVVALKAQQSQLVNVPAEGVAAIGARFENSPSRVVVQLSVHSKRLFFGWSGAVSTPIVTPPEVPFARFAATPASSQTPTLTVEMDPALADSLGLRAGDSASLSLSTGAPVASSVNVEPISSDDWEILELHAEYLESEFLKQCRVVFRSQTILIWIRKHTIIRLRVADTFPEGHVLRLDNNTEVIVAPKERSYVQPTSLAEPASEFHDLNVKGSLQKRGISARVLRLEDMVPASNKPDALVENTVFLGVSLDDSTIVPAECRIAHGLKALHGFGKVKYLRLVPWRMTPSAAASDATRENDDLAGGEAGSVRAGPGSLGSGTFHIPVVETDLVAPGCVAISQAVRRMVAVEAFSRVRLMEPKQNPLSNFKLIVRKLGGLGESITFNSKESESILPTLLKQHLASMAGSRHNDRIVLSSNTILSLEASSNAGNPSPQGTQLHVVIQLLSEAENNMDSVYPWAWGTLSPADVHSLNVIEVIKMEGDGMTVAPFKDSQDLECPSLGGIEKYVKSATTVLSSRLMMRQLKDRVEAPSLGGVLIHSNKGMGKTALAHHILSAFSHNVETQTYSHVVSCSALKGKKLSKIRESLQGAFAVSMFRSPSILLLDDLDLICPSNAENADGLGSRQITELIISQVQRFCVRTGSAPGAITLLATAADKSTIHARFISSHAIADFVHLSAPGRTQRAEILKAVLSRRGHKPEIDVMPIASATEGYRPVDLETLVSRAVHCSAVRRIGAALGGSVSVEKEIVTKDLENALSGYMPPVLKGLKMGDNDSAIGWRDIGGLHEPKKMLIETLEWPTKYAAIFASCPLRLRSGILLYGYPGCGKTILAAAVAKECGLNFISVKGPEILNKYIGESEKSVRDLFDRAQSAKPCILFFDEFDSIAPRRGNDNTGVTDRVVNQLLTQMDGAEGLDGVYVLAATSRPDLIDPALLRPGRLDKSVLCGMPSIDERIEILEAVSRKLQLSEHLDFSAYGDACENFTGADLQGLIYSAQLEAIHEQIDEKPVPSANLAPEAGGTAKGKGKGKGKAKAPIQEENVKGVHDGKSEATVQFDVLQSGDGSSKVLIGAERSKLKQRVQVIQANGWSGAVENSGSFGKTKGAITTSPSVVIYPRHFEAALAETRGSLTLQERIRFDRIFAEFAGMDDADVIAQQMKRMGKKSTMA